ncbi:MAG: cysteine--tRNA ligase [Pirellulales bacterium]
MTASATASIRVYNTLSKTKEPFVPLSPGKVGIYLCGPTVYKEAHIGHMVGPVIFDTVKRYLVYCGYDVTLVVNITDVDDKLIAEANRRGISMAQVAAENTEDYLKNLAALDVDSIDHMPKATDHIDEIVRFIEDLIAKGFAYAVDGDVFFDVTRDREYGKLSNRTADSQQGEGGGAAARKRSPGDFALWKSAKPGEPAWDSPWGKGRPGWHIECSAMSRRLLGETFDIHGGGLDLVFPHHENEIAQSECCHGKPMVTYWMHNGLMTAAAAAGKVGGRSDREQPAAEQDAAAPDQTAGKISRSQGAGGLADLIAKHGGEKLRFFLLRSHYRSTSVFGDEPVAEAGAGVDTFLRFFDRYQRVSGESFYGLPHAKNRTEGDAHLGVAHDATAQSHDALLADVSKQRAAFLTAMDDDFNSGAALAALFDMVRALNRFIEQTKLEEPAADATARKSHVQSLKLGTQTLRELAAVLGLFRTAPKTDAKADDDLVGKLVQLLIEARANARKNKDFATSDKIRDDLATIGILLEDRKEGTTWTRK